MTDRAVTAFLYRGFSVQILEQFPGRYYYAVKRGEYTYRSGVTLISQDLVCDMAREKIDSMLPGGRE